MLYRSMTLLFSLMMLGLVNPSHAQDPFEEAFGSDRLVSLATGRTQSIRQAPSVAVVITREDIDAIGATSISDVLQLVPGVHVLWRPQGDQFIFRGIRTESNESPDVLILLDGIPQNDVSLGNQRRFFSQIPFQLIERIEVIRGPYSTVLGQDAYSGVINIITADPERVRDFAQIRGGSEGTAEMRFTKRIDVAKGLAFSGQVRTTQGHRPFFERDAQTTLDQLFGTNASLAPGNGNTDFDDYNALIDLGVEEWRLRFRARGRQAGLGLGVITFDPEGQVEDRQYNMSASTDRSIGDAWRLKTDLHFSYYRIFTDGFLLFPPGTIAPGAFPEGAIYRPEYEELRGRLETQWQYVQSERHAPNVGVGVEYYVSLFDEARNYIPDPATGLPAVPLPELTPVPTDQIAATSPERRLAFAYVDDQWFFAPDWSLTVGLRVDTYSDFGTTVNPRAALVWNASPALTLKLLSGTGYRAPTFLEFYGSNTFVTGGNPDLGPVEITSSEFALNYQPSSRLSLDASFYVYQIEDLIGQRVTPPVGLISANVDDQDGIGGEVGVQWKATETLSLSGYYAHQESERDATDDSISLAPQDKVFMRADWRPTRKWQVNTTASVVMNRERTANDPREPVDDYFLLDTAVRYTPTDRWSFQLELENITNEEAISPTDSVEFDIELWDRRAFFRVQYAY